MKFYCFSLVILICVVFQSVAVISLQIINADHVRAYAAVMAKDDPFKSPYIKTFNENTKLRSQLRVMKEKRELESAEKDIKIEKLTTAVIQLYRIIERAAKSQDRET